MRCQATGQELCVPSPAASNRGYTHVRAADRTRPPAAQSTRGAAACRTPAQPALVAVPSGSRCHCWTLHRSSRRWRQSLTPAGPAAGGAGIRAVWRAGPQIGSCDMAAAASATRGSSPVVQQQVPCECQHLANSVQRCACSTACDQGRAAAHRTRSARAPGLRHAVIHIHNMGVGQLPVQQRL